jgi:hypothetical protein
MSRSHALRGNAVMARYASNRGGRTQRVPYGIPIYAPEGTQLVGTRANWNEGRYKDTHQCRSLALFEVSGLPATA